MIRRLFAAVAMICAVQTAFAQETSIQPILQTHQATIAKASRKTVQPAIDAIAQSGLVQAQTVLETWGAKQMGMRKSDGLFFGVEKAGGGYRLTDFDSGADVGQIAKSDLKLLKPNSGVRALIAAALVQFQLTDPDPAKRLAALDAISRAPNGAALAPLRASIAGETDAAIKARKQRLNLLLTIGHDPDTPARLTAINAVAGDLGIDTRAALNPLLATTRHAAETLPDANIAQTLNVDEDLSRSEAYALMVADGAAAPISDADIRTALSKHIVAGRAGGVPVAQLNTQATRIQAYDVLATDGLVPTRVTDAMIDAAIKGHVFFDQYVEPSEQITTAAKAALSKTQTNVVVNQTLDLTLDALSLASIYFLAAIGLAITFGVMGVINMAHGEFIMAGAYTGFLVQQVIADQTLSIIVAIPAAFAVTFAMGVAMERLVIRWLYARPLETLLATFGISIALQQLAKNIFGTQARPLTAPDWLDGALVINDVVAISYIRVAIFVLALLFLALFLFITTRTRLGLEMRAVTQNPAMAGSMGINRDRVNMLAFGLGSGIAGIAGVAIGLFAKVTSDLGNDYIVQSFMTVVVGGVGNIWGTLAGATMIGVLQKGIEWMNPSNTLAAQTYMIIFIIIFIQFRPRGIIALRGRAAGD